MSFSAWKERTAKQRPLQQQLLLSHLSVALVGIVLLLAALVSTYELRTRVVILASEGAPLAQSSLRVLAGVQSSVSSLRGWINLGDAHFLRDWQDAWEKEISPAMLRLSACRALEPCLPEHLRTLQELLVKLRRAQEQIQVVVIPQFFPDQQAVEPLVLDANSIADEVIALTSGLVADAEASFAQDAAAAQIASMATVSILLTSALVMLIVAYVLSRNRARALSRPISALADAVRRLQSGDPSCDLPVHRNDEMGALTRSFNQMRTAILEAQAALREANARLEERVSERTMQLATLNASLLQEIEFRTKTETALRESEARIRAMTRAIPDLVFVVDAEGRYREILAAGREWEARQVSPIQAQFSAEAQFLTASQRPEFPGGAHKKNLTPNIIPFPIRGKLLNEVHPAEIADFFLNLIKLSLDTRQIQVAEYELKTTAGSRWFESRTAPLETPLLDRRNALLNRTQLNLFEPPTSKTLEKPVAIVVARDITRRKQAETELRQAQKMQAIGQLTGGIAHDFNNLLAIMMGNLELLHEQLTDQPQLHELASQALQAVERGSALVRRLLIFARGRPLQAQPTDLNRIVSSMIEMIRRTLGASIEVKTILAADLGQTQIDLGQFESMLLNLVINARDAMPQAGYLILETANATFDSDDCATTHQDIRPGHYVMLSVTDSGLGMSGEIIERVFEPFFTTKDASKGSGLGLSMVYGLVKQAEGHITIQSEIGCGTTVCLYLPRIATNTASSAEEATHCVANAGHGEMILVVEDDIAVRAFAVKALSSLGYKTCEVGDAQTALEMLETMPEIALLFSDIVLPGHLDGVHLATEVARRKPYLPILLTSGYTENKLLGDGNPAAALEILAKPYHKVQLANKIGALLNRPAPH